MNKKCVMLCLLHSYSRIWRRQKLQDVCQWTTKGCLEKMLEISTEFLNPQSRSASL